MDENDVTEGMDRRSLIRRAGIVTAGAAAWSTPMVTSLASRAYAGSPQTGCPSCGIGSDVCGGQVPCGGGCYCSARADRSGCVCAVPTNCSNPDCTTDNDCPGNTVCLATCCATTKCFVPCNDTTTLRTTNNWAAPDANGSSVKK